MYGSVETKHKEHIMTQANAWSNKKPCGWVTVAIVRAVERGRKKGWFVVKALSRYSTIDGKRKKEHVLHPDRVNF